MSTEHLHRFHASCSWSGSTLGGYGSYEREHRAVAPPALAELHLSSDPAFLGERELLNPEQLLLVAAASCQLLSFLAVAARARMEIVSYSDEAEAVMPEASGRIGISEILLRPEITARSPATERRVKELVDLAHGECFIANSLSCPICIEPTIHIL